MSDEEIFYDSLEEDACENEEPGFHTPSVQDLDSAVPLYTGEISIHEINQSTKKRIEKPTKPVIQPIIAKKSYLTMYYEKKCRLEAKNNPGSNTSRAVCEELSPRRDLELEPDLKEAESRCINESESEQEEFYENFINLELENKQASSTTSLKNDKKRTSKFSSRSQLLSESSSERSFYFKTSKNETLEKLEVLKKRQNYGTKMSMKNKIQIEEMKTLRKIKQSKIA